MIRYDLPRDCGSLFRSAYLKDLLGGSWVVIRGVTSLLIWVITIDSFLITPLITTHEPPSICVDYRFHIRIPETLTLSTVTVASLF